MALRVGLVGTGAPDRGLNPTKVTKKGFSVAYRHAPCYEELDDTELVGCADLVPENREVFAETFDIPPDNAFENYAEMIDELDVGFVDVCTPASTHADIVVGAAEAGADAVHCEKPMANTWGGARRMVEECRRRDVQLTINHQRRFGDPFREAQRRLDSGDIGTLERVETSPPSMFSYGSHSVDLCGMFNDERAAEWVIGQVDYRERNTYSKGAHNENQALAQWEYSNGVHGLAAGGRMVGAHHRLVGTAGEIEVGPDGADTDLRIRQWGNSSWEEVDTGDHGLGGLANDYPYMVRAIGEAVSALREGYESELAGRHALKTAEIIFATYESSRRRGRVDLPLEVEDNPLESMVDSGDLDPSHPDDSE